MADSLVRRSGRQRRSNFKYSLDPEEFHDTSSDSEHDAERIRQLIDDGNDDFIRASVNENETIAEFSDVATQDSGLSINDSAPEIENVPTNSKLNVTKFSRWKKRKEVKEEHSRGLTEQAAHIQGKESVLKQLFGSDQQDWVNVLRSRDQWLAEPTLPKRQAGARGMCHFFSHTKEKRTMEASIGWDWYYQGGFDRQSVRNLTLNEGFDFIPKAKHSHKFLVGPYGKQKEFNLSHGQSFYLDAWKDAAQSRGRDGWILNIGTAITCLDWAPNQDELQYLAVAARPKPDPKLSKVSPAYTPSPLPSCLQIWTFPSKKNSNYCFLDSKRPPKLRLVICTEWGDVKQLKWCPMPRNFRDSRKNSIGLLAGIWTDGYIRILDVQLDKEALNYGRSSLHQNSNLIRDSQIRHRRFPRSTSQYPMYLSHLAIPHRHRSRMRKRLPRHLEHCGKPRNKPQSIPLALHLPASILHPRHLIRLPGPPPPPRHLLHRWLHATDGPPFPNHGLCPLSPLPDRFGSARLLGAFTLLHVDGRKRLRAHLSSALLPYHRQLRPSGCFPPLLGRGSFPSHRASGLRGWELTRHQSDAEDLVSEKTSVSADCVSS